MRKGAADGFKGKYYVLPDDEDVCIAKTCSMCREILHVSSFTNSSGYTRGLSSACQPCNQKYQDHRNGSTTPRSNSNLSVFEYKVDVSGLLEVRMRKCKGRPQGSYWIDVGTGKCMARSCAKCMSFLPSNRFSYSSSRKYNLGPTCIDCSRKEAKDRRNSDGFRDIASSYEKNRRARNKGRTVDEIDKDLWRIRPSGVKTCSSCREGKGFDQFYTCRGNTDGLQNLCIPCKHRDWVIKKYRKYEKYWKSMQIPLSCYICSSPWEEPDHVVPRARGGEDVFSNIMPICVTCNRGKEGKMDKLLTPWLESKFSADYVDSVLQRCASAGVRVSP